MAKTTRRDLLRGAVAGLAAGTLAGKPGLSTDRFGVGEPAQAVGADQSGDSGGANAKVLSTPIDQRVAELLTRMTLDEKVGQLAPAGRRGSAAIDDPTGSFNSGNVAEAFRKLYSTTAGGPHLTPREAAILRNGLQRYQVEKTPLGIPAIFQGEALHGFMEHGSTSFPQAIALASSWDEDLVERVFNAAADEMASAGVNQAFTPVINIARDPRWGRTEETYGEDPFLCSRIGVAAIRGLQGRNFIIDRHHVLSTAKHYAAYGDTQGGRNDAPANYSERVLRRVFFAPFRAAVEEANVGSVMAAYNEIDGIPCHINRWLLQRVLREEMGFRGYVTSDGGALEMLVNFHHVAANNRDAARMALAAGIDYDLSDGAVYHTLTAQVQEGRIPITQVDAAAGRVLAAKFRLGLFESPYVDPDYAERITNCAAHQKLALEAARKTIVLLKNEGGLLPLNVKGIRTVVVIGPNAADVHLGGYSRGPGSGRGVSILAGIRDRAGSGVKVLYSKGCEITEGTHGWDEFYRNNVKLADPAAQPAMIKDAVAAARKADVAIVVAGGNEGTCREAWSQEHLGDRDALDLLGSQSELIKEVLATGTPTVLVLINGRPLSINYAAAHVPAIVEAWYVGQEGGTAVAEVLFGDVNPGGKLPITFPRSAGQLPAYYNRKPSRVRSYAFADNTPIFNFGHGLSYTTFEISNPTLDKTEMGTEGSTTARATVTNTGAKEGDEVVQLYIHHRVSPVTQPVMQLAGFKRVALKPGQKAVVEFPITPDMLSIYDAEMRRVVLPGTVDLMIGSSSAKTLSVPLNIVRS